MLILQMSNFANSQPTTCETNSSGCTLPLTGNFTNDCKDGLLSNYAQCLYGKDCLSAVTANTQLNSHYCGERGCTILCKGIYIPPVFICVCIYVCMNVCSYTLYICTYY